MQVQVQVQIIKSEFEQNYDTMTQVSSSTERMHFSFVLSQGETLKKRASLFNENRT